MARSEFAVGNADGTTLILRAANEDEAARWVDDIMQTKNELLDQIRQLGLMTTQEPHVLVGKLAGF